MTRAIFSCIGGEIHLPDKDLVLVDRQDGGNLIVNPPREVWERSELSPRELIHWSYLVAATGRGMIDVLPQLRGGCVNYWEAGNWALNIDAVPKGPKVTPMIRRVHLHLFGRSRFASNDSWKWGEAPKFPDFNDRFRWSSGFRQLDPEECCSIVTAVERSLTSEYGMTSEQIAAWSACAFCKFPFPTVKGGGECFHCGKRM